MANLCKQLWNDEAGFIISAELVLVSTIAVLSLVVGLSEVSSAMQGELTDLAQSFNALNQDYQFSGPNNTTQSNTQSANSDSGQLGISGEL